MIYFCFSKNRQIRRTNHLATISLNLLLTLCASNLVFIVGVQTSKNIFKCEMIAVLLHYFHLSTAIWGLCHSYSIYNYVIHESIPIIKYNNLLAYGVSAVFVLVIQFLIQFIIILTILLILFHLNCLLFVSKKFSFRSLSQAIAMKFMIIVGCRYKEE